MARRRQGEVDQKRRDLDEMIRNVSAFKKDNEIELSRKKTMLRLQAQENKRKIDIKLVSPTF